MIELTADNQAGKPGYEGYLNGRAATIATMLRNVGYHTYMAGKWHLGKTPESIPAAQGFEKSIGVLEGGADNWENKSYSPGYKSVHFFDGREELRLPADFYSSRFHADKMMGDIDENAADGKPFFGYLAFQAVHQPHQAPAEFTARYISTYQAGWSAYGDGKWRLYRSTHRPNRVARPHLIASGAREKHVRRLHRLREEERCGGGAGRLQRHRAGTE